jgi:hypothetical protein
MTKLTWFGQTKEEVIRIAAQSVARAKRLTPNVEFSAMDATRSDVRFLAAVIEAAIHPEFVAVMTRQANERQYRALASAPPGRIIPPLAADSKLVALARVLGKSLEVLLADSACSVNACPQRRATSHARPVSTCWCRSQVPRVALRHC